MMKRSILSLVCFVFVATAFFASPARAQNASLSLFQSLPSDRPPDQITKNSHYWISNEMRLDLFHDSVKDKGGVYIGVGTDQNYLMAGWAKSEVLVLMDFDRKIADLHRAYAVSFRTAKTKEEFRTLWKDESSDKFRELLRQAYPEKKLQRDVLRAYKSARRLINIRFRKIIKQMKNRQLPTFLSDDAQYAYIRGLFVNDKVFMVAGDMTANETMQAIGKATTQAGLKVGILYLSNAEQYFEFGDAFRKNIHALPANDESLVLRTNGWTRLSYVDNTEYHYNVQPLKNFKAFLTAKFPRATRHMLLQATPGAEYGFSRHDNPPATREEAKKIHKLRKLSRDTIAKHVKARLARKVRRQERQEKQAERKRLREEARSREE